MRRETKYRLSPDFTWRERGNVIQQVNRGKSYSEVARFWSAKKQKVISFSTIKSICKRAGVKSIHKKGKGIITTNMNFHNANNIIEPKEVIQNKWTKLEIAFVIIFFIVMIILYLSTF